MSDQLLVEALDELVPAWEEAGDWNEVTARAPRRSKRRHVVTLALAAALLALFATPAFGLRHALLGWVGRLDVPFRSSHRAPLLVRKQFYDLDRGAPRQWAIRPLADEVRRISSVAPGIDLFVGPTRGGGFCWEYTGKRHELGCLAHRPTRPPVNASTIITGSSDHPVALAVAEGFVLPPTAERLVARRADGTQADVPFVFVSRPIAAGFFLLRIPQDERTAARRVTALVLYDAHHHELGRETFDYTQHPGRQAAMERRARNLLRHARRVRPPQLPRTSGIAPTAPLERVSADGVTVVAGRNGVVLFDVRDASPELRGLLARTASAGCLRFHAFHGLPDNEELLQYGRIDGTAALRLDAAGPYDACEIQAGNGHRWPDSLRGHSPVELPFSPRASRYFDDRATARDLALFVRSKRMHELRKLTGPRLAAALAATYRGAIARGEPSATGRIGYLLGPNGVTFVERSPTGRRFFVRFQAGRLAGQNLKPLAFPF